jgi:hypothetical protein
VLCRVRSADHLAPHIIIYMLMPVNWMVLYIIGMQADVSSPATLAPDFDTLTMHQGSITEAKGVSKGKNSTYHRVKLLQGGCQSSCFLVSKKTDGEDCFL